MHLFVRSIIVTGKFIRLMALVTLIRCFGPDGAAHLLANLRFVSERMHQFIANRHPHRRTPVNLAPRVNEH